MADYGNNRIYKVHDVIFDKNPLSTFMQDGKEINFIAYF
jgi:hypothetical protein